MVYTGLHSTTLEIQKMLRTGPPFLFENAPNYIHFSKNYIFWLGPVKGLFFKIFFFFLEPINLVITIFMHSANLVKIERNKSIDPDAEVVVHEDRGFRKTNPQVPSRKHVNLPAVELYHPSFL